MKKMMIVLLSLALVSGAYAQRGHMVVRGGGGYIAPRTTVVVGAGLGYYSPFYAPFGFYYGYPFYPYPYYGVAHRPSKLDMQIEDIKQDYADKIESVRMDNTLSGKERRQKVRELKRERDQAVLDARRNYYKQDSRPNNNNNSNGSDNATNNKKQDSSKQDEDLSPYNDNSTN